MMGAGCGGGGAAPSGKGGENIGNNTVRGLEGVVVATRSRKGACSSGDAVVAQQVTTAQEGQVIGEGSGPPPSPTSPVGMLKASVLRKWQNPAEPAARKRHLEEMRVHLREEFYGELAQIRADLKQLTNELDFMKTQQEFGRAASQGGQHHGFNALGSMEERRVYSWLSPRTTPRNTPPNSPIPGKRVPSDVGMEQISWDPGSRLADVNLLRPDEREPEAEFEEESKQDEDQVAELPAKGSSQQVSGISITGTTKPVKRPHSVAEMRTEIQTQLPKGFRDRRGKSLLMRVSLANRGGRIGAGEVHLGSAVYGGRRGDPGGQGATQKPPISEPPKPLSAKKSRLVPKETSSGGSGGGLDLDSLSSAVPAIRASGGPSFSARVLGPEDIDAMPLASTPRAKQGGGRGGVLALGKMEKKCLVPSLELPRSKRDISGGSVSSADSSYRGGGGGTGSGRGTGPWRPQRDDTRGDRRTPETEEPGHASDDLPKEEVALYSAMMTGM